MRFMQTISLKKTWYKRMDKIYVFTLKIIHSHKLNYPFAGTNFIT